MEAFINKAWQKAEEDKLVEKEEQRNSIKQSTVTADGTDCKVLPQINEEDERPSCEPTAPMRAAQKSKYMSNPKPGHQP